jgi:hypothetical protein
MTRGLLVFSLPGCGGGQLAELLGAHPALRGYQEPFNPDVPDPTGRRVARPTVAGVDAVLEGIWAEWPVIAHVWDPTGWPFPRHSALNGHVLLRASRVVLLSRQNMLAAAVCAALAERRRLEPPAEGLPGPTAEGPLDMDRIAWMLTQIPSALRTHRRVLFTRDRPKLDTTWERFFGMDASPAARSEALEEVFAFFGHSSSDEGMDRERIRLAMDAGAPRPGVDLDFRRIPNIEEIERRLGSDETGWLLRGTG